MAENPTVPAGGDRLAKVIARAGLCSRRDAEGWIRDGRVAVNGKLVKTPAFNVTERDRIEVDGAPLVARQGTRVWLYHKPPGLVVTEKDPEGRETIFTSLAEQGLPRVLTIGRLDINTEGLLLLTNDGGLKRVLELPATGWLRKYRVRAFGTVTQADLDRLQDGIEIDGIAYGPIEARLEREQGANTWLQVALREGKNREVKNVLGALGLQVNRLIRISFGPFQLGDIPVGGIETVKARVLRDQLGKRLAAEAGVDFDSEPPGTGDANQARTDPRQRAAAPGRERPAQRPGRPAQNGGGRPSGRPARDAAQERPVRHRPGRFEPPPRRPPRRAEPAVDGPPRHIHFDDGRDAEEFRAPAPRRSPGADRQGADGPGQRSRPRGDRERPRGGEGRRADQDGAARPPRATFGDSPRPARAFRSEDRPADSRSRGSSSAARRGAAASEGKPAAPARQPGGPSGARPVGGPGGRPSRPGGTRPGSTRPGGPKPAGPGSRGKPPRGGRSGGERQRPPRKPRS